MSTPSAPAPSVPAPSPLAASWPTPGPTHVAEALARIVPVVDPLQVVVFGSVARGEARPGSDLDLLVVLPDGTDRRTATIALLVALADLDVPKDVVVTTPKHMALQRDSCAHVVAFALNEGSVVYDRP